MCGIAGLVNVHGGYEIMRKMLNVIKHRGPDGEGIEMLSGNRVVLGHVRLSIIDLSVYASQPMKTSNGRYTIIYNGELYNYRELKKELQEKGHAFFSHSDTEVVLESYVEWGKKCLEKFNGMFAFAVWDEYKKEIFLARDRYGVKPLYYTTINNGFMFASEQKAIIQHPDFKRAINPKSLKEYFTFQNIFSDDMLLKEIKILPAGSYLAVDIEHISRGRPVQYWDYHFEEPEQALREEEYVEQLQYLFRRSIKRQLVSDVPVGSYLSGGMDSGSITALASKDIRNLKTFTCGFDLHSASGIEMAYDEREKSEQMSYQFGTEHYEVVLKAGDMERCMRELIWAIEEPRVGQSYPNYYVSRLASKFVKVVLSGAGGDELFGGYPWRYYRSVKNENFGEYVDKYYAFWQRLVPQEIQDELLSPLGKNIIDIDEKETFMNVFRFVDKKNVSPEQCVNHSMYFEAKTFLHGLLVIEDKISMASGLETRVPFLDNELVDFAMKLPVSMKLSKLAEVVRVDENESGLKTDKYYQRTKDGKKLLRKSMGNLIPKEIIEAEKQGFTPPDNAWFRGESIQYIKSIVFDNSAVMYDYLDRKTVQKLVTEHITGQRNWRLFVWSVLVFNQWCYEFMVGRPNGRNAVIRK